MTIEQAVKVSNLLQELEAIDALGSQMEKFLSDNEVPSKLTNDIKVLVAKAYNDKKKEIESL